eukprot:11203574-Lingulodinium_polyedra.AAC.1
MGCAHPHIITTPHHQINTPAHSSRHGLQLLQLRRAHVAFAFGVLELRLRNRGACGRNRSC